VKNCCGAETIGIMVSNGEQIIIYVYNEVVVTCLQMISLCEVEIRTREGSKGMREGC
jgi:hypothetical protein